MLMVIDQILNIQNLDIGQKTKKNSRLFLKKMIIFRLMVRTVALVQVPMEILD